jgi:hypothetical protein
LHKGKYYKTPKCYILILVQIKLQEKIEMNMGWNGNAYEMVKHEMKEVSSTTYNEVIIRQEDTKQRQKTQI